MQMADLVPTPYLEKGSSGFHIQSYLSEAPAPNSSRQNTFEEPNTVDTRVESFRNISIESASEMSQANYHV